MRDRDHGAPVLGQEALEPRDRLGVEVVRRLVEQQQIGGGEEEPAERDAPPLAARERSDVLVAGRAAKRVHCRVERLVEAPRVMAVDLLLESALLHEQRVEVGIRLGELRRDHVEAVEQIAQRPYPVLDVPAHVLARVQLGLLREKADGRPGRELCDARGGLVEAGHDAEQRGLAGAVRPKNADLRARKKAERDVCEHLPVRAVELVDPVHRVDELHMRTLSAGVRRLPGCSW